MFVDEHPECCGSQLRSPHCFHFPNSAPTDKDGYDLFGFTGCQRGLRVTVFRLKLHRHAKKGERREHRNKFIFIKQMTVKMFILTRGRMKEFI